MLLIDHLRLPVPGEIVDFDDPRMKIYSSITLSDPFGITYAIGKKRAVLLLNERMARAAGAGLSVEE